MPTMACGPQGFMAAEVLGDLGRNLIFWRQKPSLKESAETLSHRVCPAACLPKFLGAGSSQRQEGIARTFLTG